jgi:hypothetical protein
VTPTVEQFLEIEQWAMKELEVTEPDSLWMVQTAIVLRRFGLYDLSSERSRKSHEMDPKNWRAPFCLAQISALQGKYEEALTLLDKVIEMFKADDTLMEVWRDTYYDNIVYFQGDWNVEVKQFDKAIASYREIHAANQTHTYRSFGLLRFSRARRNTGKLWTASKRWAAK